MAQRVRRVPMSGKIPKIMADIATENATVMLPAPETKTAARCGAGFVVGGSTLQVGHDVVAVTDSGSVWLVGGSDGISGDR